MGAFQSSNPLPHTTLWEGPQGPSARNGMHPAAPHPPSEGRRRLRLVRRRTPGRPLGASDSDLINQISNADTGAMKSLYARHQLRVFRFIKRMVRNPAIAEEVTNEVFLEVWRGARSFQGRSTVTTWLLAIARKRALNVLRKRREENWDEEDAHRIPDEQDDPEVASQKAGKSAILRQCAEALSPLHREIIDLVYFHEMSVRQASEVLDVPEGTVKARLFKARKKLHVALTAAGVDRGWP